MHVWRQFLFLFICFYVDVFVLREYVLVKDFITGTGDVVISQEHHYDLIVGILSARSNFNLRESLRKTWVGHTKNLKERILVKFIISDQACLIPPEYRTDAYHCQENLHNLIFDRDLVAYTSPLPIQFSYFSSSPVGRDFSVLHPIIITHLGTFENRLDVIEGNTTVRLYDKITKKEIASANFSLEDCGTLINGSWFKAIPNFVLPKDFQASIVSENFHAADPACTKSEEFIDIQDGRGIIVTHQVRRFDDNPGIFPQNEETIYDKRCPYTSGTFIYQAHVSGDLSYATANDDGKELRLEEWKKLKYQENIRLLNESRLFSDILFVPNIDVYRNLPSQLLEFYKWVSKNISFSFTLKTDDDCFIDIESILKAIYDYKLGTKSKVWWSRFRTNWLVDRVGKWAEPDYPGATYPTFACGAGYVLSADLVHWLARNADSLKRYQGEDVSMGIWLSAVGPNILKDQRWSCFQECFNGMLTSPEQDTESLHEMWENFQTCGNPCLGA